MKSATNPLARLPDFFTARSICGMPVHLRTAGRQRLALVDLELLREDAAASLLLSEEERKYFERFQYTKRRREWLGGRVAVKAALLHLAEADDFQRQAQQVSILPDVHGRPTISGPAGQPLALSVSHSGGYAAAMAVRGISCGIDLQRISAKISSLATRFASPAELDMLARQSGLGSEETRLTMLWAVKEAVKKSVLADQPVFFAGIEAVKIVPAGERGWLFVCTAGNLPAQLAVVYDFSPYILALTQPHLTKQERWMLH